MQIRPLYGPDIDIHFLNTLRTLSEVNVDVDTAKKVFLARLKQGWKTLVAIEDTIVVGTGSILIEQKFTHGNKKAGGFVGHIEDVSVHQDYQGKGIGKELIQHLINIGKNADCYKIILDCSIELAVFYRSLGFNDSGLLMRLDKF